MGLPRLLCFLTLLLRLFLVLSQRQTGVIELDGSPLVHPGLWMLGTRREGKIHCVFEFISSDR